MLRNSFTGEKTACHKQCKAAMGGDARVNDATYQ